jgi:hypothetical protein
MFPDLRGMVPALTNTVRSRRRWCVCLCLSPPLRPRVSVSLCLCVSLSLSLCASLSPSPHCSSSSVCSSLRLRACVASVLALMFARSLLIRCCSRPPPLTVIDAPASCAALCVQRCVASESDARTLVQELRRRAAPPANGVPVVVVVDVGVRNRGGGRRVRTSPSCTVPRVKCVPVPSVTPVVVLLCVCVSGRTLACTWCSCRPWTATAHGSTHFAGLSRRHLLPPPPRTSSPTILTFPHELRCSNPPHSETLVLPYTFLLYSLLVLARLMCLVLLCVLLQ